MIRENRYLVLKNEDISAALTADELTELIRLEEKVNLYRSIRTKKPVECVVVEHDWPMHEHVWGLIERWVDNIENNSDTPEFTQGVVSDGAAILKDGQMMGIEEILNALRALAGLIALKNYKDDLGADEFYEIEKPLAWAEAKIALAV